MKKWGLIAVLALLVAAFGMKLRQSPQEPELFSHDRQLSGMLRKALARQDSEVYSLLLRALDDADDPSRARIQELLVRRLRKSLHTQDNLLWKPYTFVRTRLPPYIARVLPAWKDPTMVRRNALWWLSLRGPVGGIDSVPLGLRQRVTPTLCYLVRKDPWNDIRQVATLALCEVGTFSPEVLQIMLDAVNSPDPDLIAVGARYFQRHPINAEQVVPPLISGLEEPLTRIDCALTLRAYGPQAKFAVGRLLTLARGNDPYASAKAIWALEGIDPEVAKKAGAPPP
jgi:hypothetical protein